MKRRILSLLLALCIAASLLAGVASAKNYTSGVKGSDFTNDPSLAKKLDNVFNGAVKLFSNTDATFKLGQSLDITKSYKVANALSGYQCYIYANAVYYYLTGDIPFRGSGLSAKYFQHSKTLSGFKGKTSVSYDMFRDAGVGTGAYIRTTTKTNGDYDGNNGHSMILLKYDKSGVWVLHGNANGKGLVCVTQASWSDFNNNFLTKHSRRISHIVQPTATMVDTYNLFCHNNYSGKNYLFGTDFTIPLEKNPDILYSRDESVTKVSIDDTTTCGGYNSLKIVNTAAGGSGKDLAIYTETSNRAANGWLGDNKDMTLSFWAKASGAGTKLYFRWGYETEYRSVTLTQDWAFYTLPMNKTTAYGCDMHPYVDRAGTVWLAQIQLEDGTEATAFVPENVKLNYETVTQTEGEKYQLPTKAPVRQGYTFDGWFTAKSGGVQITPEISVKDGSRLVFAHWTKDPCEHAYELVSETAPTCEADGEKQYICTLCGETFTETVEALGHDYEETQTLPTCTAEGIATYTCTRCGDSYEEIYAEALGHDFADGVCTRCGAKQPDTAATVARVGFDHKYLNDEEFAVITGYTEDGKTVWTYTTEKYRAAQMMRVRDVGMWKDRYYYVDDGHVAALDKETGTLLWKNEDGVGGSAKSCIGEDGTVFLLGGVGHFCAVDKNGVTLVKKTFGPYGEDEIEDYSLKLQGSKTLQIHMEGYDYAEKKPLVVDVYLDLTNYSFRDTPDEPTPGQPCDGGETCPSKAFKDVNFGDWYHEAVDFAVTNGLFNGMSANSFEPNTAMSRAMLVTVLWRYAGSLKQGASAFTDVPTGQWYTDAVAWAASNDIVNGVGGGKFDPNGNITRIQMAAILYRYAGADYSTYVDRADLTVFPDWNAVSAWGKDAYGWAVTEGLITGNDGRLDPMGKATRAQVATILMRYITGEKPAAPTCEHAWQAATCFAPKTCTKCGATEGTKLAHSLNEGGYACTRCGHRIYGGLAVMYTANQSYARGGGCTTCFFEDGTYKCVAGGSTLFVRPNGTIPTVYNYDGGSGMKSIIEGTWQLSGSFIECEDTMYGTVRIALSSLT